ncbi:MAG: ribonuclease HII [Bacteriovoracaceae bacterium]|nr:ribonuclease HII [Bacteriovoracaceae bacterium]
MSQFKDTEYLKSCSEIIGCDEVGRGPIAGPVVGCALKITKENTDIFKSLESLGVSDSKKLSAKRRLGIIEKLEIEPNGLELNQVITRELDGCKFEFVLCEHSPQEIDKINILQASLSCMKNAARELLGASLCTILVDGNKSFDLDEHNVESVIKGDSKFLTIALASIIAKEYRDEKMRAFDLIYPGYGLSKHAGYPTEAHRNALKVLGVTPIHRQSFKGVKELV